MNNDISTSYTRGMAGLTAYEVAVNNGFVGSETEWLVSLQQPALDAQTDVLETNVALIEAEQIRSKEFIAKMESIDTTFTNTQSVNGIEFNQFLVSARASAAELIDTNRQVVTAEQSRVSAERVRVESENDRQSKTKSAIEAVNRATSQANDAKEDIITTNNTIHQSEVLRVESEQSRVLTETNREDAENLRVTIEGSRVTAEQSRANVEKDRVHIETLRVNAEISRVTEEGLRVIAEEKRVNDTQAAIKGANMAKDSAIEATATANEAISSLTIIDGGGAKSLLLSINNN